MRVESRTFAAQNGVRTVIESRQMPTAHTIAETPVPVGAPSKATVPERYLALDAYRGFIMLILASGGFGLFELGQQRPEFARVPRIMLSNTAEQNDPPKAQQLGCCAFFTKPVGFNALVDLVKHLDDEWISQHCPIAGQ